MVTDRQPDSRVQMKAGVMKQILHAKAVVLFMQIVGANRMKINN